MRRKTLKVVAGVAVLGAVAAAIFYAVKKSGPAVQAGGYGRDHGTAATGATLATHGAPERPTYDPAIFGGPVTRA